MQASREIATFNITEPHKAPDGATSLSCKVSFELDLHGLVRCVQALHCHKVEVEDAAPAETSVPTSTPAESGIAQGEEVAPATADAMETDQSAAAAPAVVKKTKKVGPT